MPVFLIRYRYIDDAEALAAVRPAHREWLRSLGAMLVGSGPTADNGAALVVQAQSADEAGVVFDADPFAEAGFVAERSIVEWTLVLGRWAEEFQENPLSSHGST
jgi:uncharacterized protein